MPIPHLQIADTIAAHLARHPQEQPVLAEPLRLLAGGGDFTSRRQFPMHVTVGALVTRPGPEILLIRHRAYDILLQPGGHLEPVDRTLPDAAMRELTEETGIDPGTLHLVSEAPVYIEYALVPARPAKHEPEHLHLDLGYAFTTTGDIGQLQEAEVTSAAWYPLSEAERLVGPRIARASAVPRQRS
jgi:8-oxo-dGTP pyrophosphatase MutT (NUDIX family)